MSTGYTWPSRSNVHFKFLTSGHSGAQPLAPECPNVRNLICTLDLDGTEHFENHPMPLPFKGLTVTAMIQTVGGDERKRQLTGR